MENTPMNIQVRPRSDTAKRALPFECVALVLQGGGALGAYQAGVYEALADARIDPDWIAGISIGAINAAIIAGNPPEAVVFLRRAKHCIVRKIDVHRVIDASNQSSIECDPEEQRDNA